MGSQTSGQSSSGTSLIGQTISHYKILGKLGGGGMGVVYEAEDTRLGRHVAIKFLPDNLTGDSKAMERFEREARAASLLNHPSICTIFEVEDHNGHPFIVMEKLEGDSLKQHIRGKPMDVDELLDVGSPGGRRAVRFPRQGNHSSRHQAGQYLPHVQRADKSSGLRPGEVVARRKAWHQRGNSGGRLADRGGRDSRNRGLHVSGTGAQRGTRRLAPIFFPSAWCCMRWRPGKKPFSGNNVVTTLDAVLHTKPPSPLTLNPTLPKELEGIIGKAMEKDRAKRYTTAAEMKADLQHLKKETESGLTRAGARESSRLRVATKTFETSGKPLNYLLLGLSALLLTVLIAVGIWWFKHRAAVVPAAANNAIAVLPLTNLNGDFSVDYLRFALADEVANVLTYSRTLDVRPSNMTAKYVSADLDPQKVGRQLHVGNVITGHFMKQGTHLLVTLEAIETATNRVLWQTNLTGSTQDLIARATATGQAGPHWLAAHPGSGCRISRNQHSSQQSGSLRSLFAQRSRAA